MTDRDITHLCPELQAVAKQFLDKTNSCVQPSVVRLIVTYRDNVAQDAAKANGLSNAAAGQSPHNCVDADGKPASKAFDFGIFEQNGTYVSDGRDSRYTSCAEIGKSLGLVWGGDWKHPDYDHLEMENWKTS